MRLRNADYRLRWQGRAIDAFVECGDGDSALFKRASQIQWLPSKDWKGGMVFQVHCDGDYGRGPHDHFVPEGILWSLISVDHYRCPFHTR